MTKIKIPEKGRIRFVLAVILVIIAIKYSAPAISEFFAGREQLRETAQVVRQERKRREHQISFNEVSKLVRDNDINVDSPLQTILRDRGKDTLTLSLSIDTVLQKYAQSMFRRYKPRYAAMAAIDPATGRVLALASYAGEGEEISGGDLYLRAIFPAASVFKTIVAAAGIERAGMTSQTTIPHFGRSHTLYRTQLQENLRASRDVTLQDAFAYSMNPVFARIALFNTNKDVVFETGARFGFNDTIPFELDAEVSQMFYPDEEFSVAEFASGFNRKTSISPLFGAMIAAVVCNGGIMYEPTLVDRVYSSARDTAIYARESNVWRRAVKESTALELRLLMTKVTQYGTARTAFRPLRSSGRYGRFEFGGKTGNVNKLGLGRVDWFVGFARNPNDINQQIAVGVVTTHGEYWTVQSSYIASELFKRYIITEEQSARVAANQ